MWAFATRLNQKTIAHEDFDPEQLNDPDAISNFTTSISVSWELFSGGRTQAGLEQAKQNQQTASVSLKKVRQEIIAHTSKAYIGLLLARENLEVIEQAVETARAHSVFIESRYKGGFVVKSDLLRAQVRLAELEQERLSAQSRVNVAQAALNASMGSYDNPHIQTTTPFQDCVETQGSLEDWIERAISNHPDIEHLDLLEGVAESEIRKAKADHWPSLHLVGSYDMDTEGFNDFGESYAVGAMAQIPLYRGGQTRSAVLAATAAWKQAQEMKKSARLLITLKNRQAYYETQSAWKRIAVAKSALEQAEEGLRIVENRYRNGMLTLVSLLDAEMARREARVNHFKALHDYKVARIDLMLAAGVIDTEWKK
jgi:outer membrane protein TolC